MPEYTVFTRIRIDKDGKEKKFLKVKRFRLPIILVKKDGTEIVIKKNTDMRFGSNIVKLGHLKAKTKKEAIMLALQGKYS